MVVAKNYQIPKHSQSGHRNWRITAPQMSMLCYENKFNKWVRDSVTDCMLVVWVRDSVTDCKLVVWVRDSITDCKLVVWGETA